MSTMSLPFKDGRRLAVRGGGRTKAPVKVSVRFPVLPQAVEEETETVVVEAEPVPEVTPVAGDAPKMSASRAKWRDYAISQGINPDGLNRQQIQEATSHLAR